MCRSPHRRGPRAALLVFATLAGPAGARAQDTLPLPPRAECGECAIVLRHIGRLGGDTGVARLGVELESIVADSRGRLLVVEAANAPLKVYRRDGTFLRLLEEPDPVPDQPWIVRLVGVAAGDTIHLLDETRAQHLVFDPDFRLVRRRPTPVPLQRAFGAMFLPGDSVLMSGPLYDRDHVGYPLHLLDPDGQIVSSFGSDRPIEAPAAEPNVRTLSPSGGAHVWVGHLTHYVFERWRLDGTKERVYQPARPWFAPYNIYERPPPGRAPPPRLIDLREDAAGRLWVLSTIPDAGWATADRAEARRRRTLTYTAENLERIYDTMIEVFEPACGRMLASIRLPAVMRQMIDDNHLAGWRASGTAPPTLDVWHVELQQPDGGIPTCSASSQSTAR